MDSSPLGYSAAKATPPSTPASSEPPAVALRLVTTYDDRTRRVDIALGGAESVAVEDGVATTFPTERLWPVVRELLPPVQQLTADPRGRPAPERRDPGPGFAEDCRAFVALATVVDERVSVRTWLATDDELWSVEARADGTTDLRPAAEGAVADLLVWDVTAALEVLVADAERRAS